MSYRQFQAFALVATVGLLVAIVLLALECKRLKAKLGDAAYLRKDIAAIVLMVTSRPEDGYTNRCTLSDGTEIGVVKRGETRSLLWRDDP